MSSRGLPITQAMRDGRRKSAIERQAAYDKLSIQEKLDRLPKDGAKKQRAKLLVLLEKQNNKGQVQSS